MIEQEKFQEMVEIMADYEAGIELDLEMLILERTPASDLSEFISKELVKRNFSIQADVLRIFAKAGHQEILPFIEPLLSNPDQFVKLYTATALAHLNEKLGFQLLRDIALDQNLPKQDPNYIPINWVLEHLGEVNNTKARELEREIRDKKGSNINSALVP
jgi:hypothetical protein